MTQLMFDKAAVGEPYLHTSAQPALPDHFLVRLIRLIFYIRHITLDDFARLYQTHGTLSHWASSETRIRHNNDRKAITTGNKMTMYLFSRIAYSILRMDIVGIAVVVRNRQTGQRTTYCSSDSVD
jgi:hypothetical protein